MSAHTESLRNIAVTGHVETGKTSFCEQALFDGGQIPKAESIESGKTVSDFTDEEINRRISIHTSLLHLDWQGKKINLLDTPGLMDFFGDLAAALRAVETALILVGADVGVQIGTIRIWRWLEEKKLPRMIFINKMDKEHADFSRCLEDLKNKFQASFVPLMLPLGSGAAFKGTVNLLSQKARSARGEAKAQEPAEIPAEIKDQVAEYRKALVEAAAEGDDALIEKFFEQESLSDEEILLGLSKGLRAGKLVPVFCGVAARNAGVADCLDILSAIAPAPGGEAEAAAADGTALAKKIDPASLPSCFVFKTSIDQFSGKLSYAKVISGTIQGDSELLNPREDKREKIGKVYTCQGKKLEETDGLAAGDIGLFVKLASTATNDTLCSPDEIVKYPPLKLRQPVHSMAVSALAKKDEDKLNQMLQRAAEEDPTFRIAYNPQTKENIISGMGELHLNIILEKIKTNQKIEVETRLPKVPYRETITASSSAEYQHKKQTGGHGQYAKVALEIAPLPRGENFKFTNAIFGGAVSRNYIPGVEKGVLEGMENGILAGYPVVDLEAKIVDGKMHPVDSSELAFKLAGRGALRAALEKAKPALLEPIMNLSVFVDDQYLGDVLSDLSSRRGRVLGQELLGGGIQEIKAQVPMAELLRYSVDLRSLTSGSATFEMEFSHYSPITGRTAEEVIKAAAAHKEEQGASR